MTYIILIIIIPCRKPRMCCLAEQLNRVCLVAGKSPLNYTCRTRNNHGSKMSHTAQPNPNGFWWTQIWSCQSLFIQHRGLALRLLAGLQTVAVWKPLTCDEVDFVTAEMDADHVGDKRARLLVSKTRWREMGDVTAAKPLISACTGRMSS